MARIGSSADTAFVSADNVVAAPYFVDVFTGGVGVYAPFDVPNSLGEIVAAFRGRPLPAQFGSGGCVLCAEVVAAPHDGSELVVVKNAYPLVAHDYVYGPHVMFVSREHMVYPVEVPVSVWREYLLLCGQLTARNKDQAFPYVYGNLGAGSGGSQPHFHVQVLPAGHSGGSRQGTHEECVACNYRGETLREGEHLRVVYVWGGPSGEVALIPKRCTRVGAFDGAELREFAEMMAYVWAKFALLSDSGNLSHHFLCSPGGVHEVIKLAPVVSSPAALEVQHGLKVSRLTPGHVKTLLG